MYSPIHNAAYIAACWHARFLLAYRDDGSTIIHADYRNWVECVIPALRCKRVTRRCHA